MQNISIQVKDLQKSYKKLTVLKGVHFTVERGSIFALLGSNEIIPFRGLMAVLIHCRVYVSWS